MEAGSGVLSMEIEIQMCNLLMDVRLTLRWFGLFLGCNCVLVFVFRGCGRLGFSM